MKKSAFYLALAGTLVIIFSVYGCNNKKNEPKEKQKVEAKAQEAEFDRKTAKKEIIKANTEFSKLFAAKDSVGVAKLYTQDAKFMMHGSPAITGRENIQSAISGFINSGFSKVDLRTVDVWGTKDLVIEEGELTLYKEGTEVDRGKYMVLWKKVNGKWHLFRDIFNSNSSPE